MWRQSLSVGVASGAYGVSFGALATASGLSAAQACALSALMFTGGSQFALIGVLGAGGSGLAGAASAVLLGARNGLYAVQVAPLLRVRGLRRVLAAQLTIDESTAVATAQRVPAVGRLGFWAAGVSVFVLWNAATLLGALAGGALGVPGAWGLDAAAGLAALDPAGRALLFGDARTANTFDGTAVSDEQLQGIWELARWAPTAANTQPLRVLYVRTGEGRERLLRHMADGNKVKTGMAPAVAVLARDTRFYDHLPTVMTIRPGMRDQFAGDPQRVDMTGTYNAALQAGYFLFAVRAVGLATGPMGGFDAEGIDREFFPDGRFASTLVVNIGHPGPDAWFPRLPRLAHQDVLSWA